jgi:hypothetical protein
MEFIVLCLRRVWRYQRGNQNPYIEEEQTTQWPKEKVQRDKQRSTKHMYKTKDRVTQTSLKIGDEHRCFEMILEISCAHDTVGHIIYKKGKYCCCSFSSSFKVWLLVQILPLHLFQTQIWQSVTPVYNTCQWHLSIAHDKTPVYNTCPTLIHYLMNQSNVFDDVFRL